MLPSEPFLIHLDGLLLISASDISVTSRLSNIAHQISEGNPIIEIDFGIQKSGKLIDPTDGPILSGVADNAV